MSKKSEITSELLETILVKVTEKLTDIFKSFVDQLMTSITDRVDRKLDDLTEWLNSIERNFNQPSQQACGSVELATIKSLMDLEDEKAEREKRSRNVIITGLHRKAKGERRNA